VEVFPPRGVEWSECFLAISGPVEAESRNRGIEIGNTALAFLSHGLKPAFLSPRRRALHHHHVPWSIVHTGP
jgi:hypothetical protein